MKLLKKFGSYFEYRTIRELPLSKWLQVHESGELKHLIRHSSVLYLLLVRLHLISRYSLKEAWNEIYEGYIKEFGLSPAYADYLDKTRMLIYAIIDHALDNSSINHTYLRIAEEDLKMFFDANEKTNFGMIHAVVEKWKGFRMPVDTVTVFEFYSAYKAMETELKQREQSHTNITDDGRESS